jgi:hypothetical protein
MALLSAQDVLLGNSNFVSQTTAQYDLGTRGYTRDGRAFRYVLAGAANLVAGEVMQSPAVLTGCLAIAVNTTSGVALGATVVSATCGTTVPAGFYNDGYIVIASGAGQGLMYQVKSHAAVSTGATGAFTLYDDDGLAVAITTTSTVSLIANKYNGVIQLPATTATSVCVGVACYAIQATQYGWIQTWGPCACKGSDTAAVGISMNCISTSGGRMSSFTAASLLTGQAIGNLMQADVAAQWCVIDLKVAP